MFARQLRRLYRRFFPRIQEQTAIKYARRLRFFYAFFAWNAFGMIVWYQLSKGPSTEEEKRRMAHGWAAPLTENVTKVKIHGLSRIEYTAEGSSSATDSVDELFDDQSSGNSRPTD